MALNFTTLQETDLPVKVLFTGYLSTVAVGYFVALVQILFTHGMADGKFGLSVDDIVYSYYGNRSGTVIEKMLNGSMKQYASEQERFAIIQWVRDGADQDEYEDEGIKKIIETNCIACHGPQASGIPNYTNFEEIKEVAKQDEGATFGSLTRVSHIHLFGISFIFMFVGLIFSYAETPTVKYKCIAIGMPYAFLLVDILSWWLTKLSPMFAWLVIFAGMGMGVSFISMWVISLFEMWIFKPVFLDEKGQRYQQWSTFIESKLKDMGLNNVSGILKYAGCQVKKLCLYLWSLWLNHGWPFVKQLTDKYITSKK